MSSSEWFCGACTMANENSLKVCSMCNTARPKETIEWPLRFRVPSKTLGSGKQMFTLNLKGNITLGQLKRRLEDETDIKEKCQKRVCSIRLRTGS